jgi:hypothetical protein
MKKISLSWLLLAIVAPGYAQELIGEKAKPYLVSPAIPVAEGLVLDYLTSPHFLSTLDL